MLLILFSKLLSENIVFAIVCKFGGGVMLKPNVKFDFHYEERKKYFILFLEGELYDPYAQGFHNKFINLMKNRTCIIIDLSGLAFISSSGLGLLVGQFHAVRRVGSRIILVGANHDIFRSFETAGISDVFKIFDTIDKAEDYIMTHKIR